MKVWIYIVIFLNGLFAFSQVEEHFEQANSAYADDDFQQAIQLYTQILNEDKVSAELYFNLGNAYFKSNDLANAIYHYEKALQLNPADSDIRENLEIANTQTIDKVEDAPESQINSLMYTITHLLKLESWAWVSIVFSVLFGTLIVLYFRTASVKGKRKNFSFAVVFLILAIASLLFGRFQKQLLEEESYAIVFENQLPALVEPNPRSDINFELNKGTKVSLGSNFRDYTQIILSDGSKGWVKTSALKRL